MNALYPAGELLVWIRDRAARLATEGPFDPRFDPPHSTLQAGVIRGGSAVNIIPDRAVIDIEVRSVPGQAPQEVTAEVLAELHAVAARSGVRASSAEFSSYPACHRPKATTCPACWRGGPGKNRWPPSAMAPRPGCSTRPASPRSSAGREASPARIAQTSSSWTKSLKPAAGCCWPCLPKYPRPRKGLHRGESGSLAGRPASSRGCLEFRPRMQPDRLQPAPLQCCVVRPRFALQQREGSGRIMAGS